MNMGETQFDPLAARLIREPIQDALRNLSETIAMHKKRWYSECADTDTGAAGGAGRMDRTESTGSAGAAEGPGSAGNADRTGSNPRKAAHPLRCFCPVTIICAIIPTLQLLSGANRMRWLIATRGIICGLIAGVLVVGYRWALSTGHGSQ